MFTLNVHGILSKLLKPFQEEEVGPGARPPLAGLRRIKPREQTVAFLPAAHAHARNCCSRVLKLFLSPPGAEWRRFLSPTFFDFGGEADPFPCRVYSPHPPDKC